MHRRSMLASGLALPGLVMAGRRPAAATWPERPVTLIVPFGAGSQPDLIGRLLAERLAVAWRQPVVVQNVPGASATIGVDRVAKAAPDGYTIGLTGDGAMVVRVSMDPPIPYDPRRDLAPIRRVVRTRNALVVHPSVPASTLQEFLALLRARPGQLSYAHSGVGFSTHLGMEMLKQVGGVDLAAIPYANDAQLVADLLQGRVQATIAGAAMVPRIQAGEVRALAVVSADRSPALPGIATVAEQGFPGFESVAWFGLVAPARTAEVVVARIERDAAAALAEPAIRERLGGLGLAIVEESSSDFAALIPRETDRMAAVLERLGLRAR